MSLHLTVIIVYSGALILMGLWIGRRVRGSADFFVAGRALGPGLIFATVLAANIGAGSTVGAAGLGYRDGLSAWWWVGSAGIGTLLLAFWVGPRIREMAAKHGFYTVGDLLEHRYGVASRYVIMGSLWFGTLAVLAAQLIALAAVLQAVVGAPLWVGCVIGGVVMTTYFTAGGLVGAAWINFIQLVVLLGAFMIAVPLALTGVGGWEGLAESGAQVSGDYLAFWRGGASGWVLLPLIAPNFIVSPGLLQKAYGARSMSAVRWGIGLSAFALFLFAFAPALLGMIARVHHPELARPDLALPTLLVQDLPIVVGAIGLGALFMADVSSADAALFMLSTSFSQDFYRRFLKPEASDRQVLTAARLAAIGGGVVSTGLAVVSRSVVDVIGIFYSLVGVALFVPVLAGLYTGRAGAPEALASVIGGFSVGIAALVLLDAPLFGVFTGNLLGIIAAAVAFFVMFWVRARSASRPHEVV